MKYPAIRLLLLLLLYTTTGYAQQVNSSYIDTVVSANEKDTIFVDYPIWDKHSSKFRRVASTIPHFKEEWMSILEQRVRVLMKDSTIKGMIRLYCEINTSGAATNCVVLDAPYPLYKHDNPLKQELLNVVYAMPYWVPGTMDGAIIDLPGTQDILLR